MQLPVDVPREAVPFLTEVGYLDEDRLALGDQAPDLPLHGPEGVSTSLGALWANRPLVLIFGSYT